MVKPIEQKEKEGYTRKETKIIQEVHKRLRNYDFEDKELPTDDYYSYELCYAIIYAYELGKKQSIIKGGQNKSK